MYFLSFVHYLLTANNRSVLGTVSMDALVSCNSCTSFYRRPPLHRQLLSPKRNNYLKCPRVTRSELQTSVGVTTDRAGNQSPSIPTHKVTVRDRQRGVVHEFLVPESYQTNWFLYLVETEERKGVKFLLQRDIRDDQYILHTAESQNIILPFACRHGCCTSCAVRVKSGQIRQPEALGISAELKSKGYALLCVGFPSSDVEVETQDEDEVYWLQFGRYFARGPVERDDYALELAMGDE